MNSERSYAPAPPSAPAPWRPVIRFVALVGVALAAACGLSDSVAPRSASVVLSLAMPGGRTSSLVIPDSAVLTITGPAITTPIIQSVLFDTSGTARATVTLPIGTGYVLKLDMYKSGALIFSGTSVFDVGAGVNPPTPVTPVPVVSPIAFNVLLPGGSTAFPVTPDSAVLLVSGSGLTTPLRLAFTFNASGVAVGSASVPVGATRPVQVDMYRGGALVFSGTSTISIAAGSNPTQVITPTQTSSPIILNIAIAGGVPAGVVIPDSAVFTVTGLGISPAIRGAFPFNAAGVSQATLTVPVGANRSLKVDLYQAGSLVFSGTSTFVVTAGTNPTQQITPTPTTGSVPITVTVGSFAVTMNPTAATVIVGNTTLLTATVRDATGALAAGVSAIFATSNPAIATVNPATGLVSAVHSGSTTITATALGSAATATITVP